MNLRVRVRSFERKKLRATCIVIVEAPWRTPPETKFDGGARDADIVDAAVLVEALVLGGQDRREHGLRHVCDRHEGAALFAELAEKGSLQR